MAQCEKLLENNQRCSNQAVPGTRYCETHGRIVFKPVKPPADTAPPPAPPPVAPTTRAPVVAAPQLAWQAAPASFGATPAFPGLLSDERQILVAPEGIIWLQAEGQAQPEEQFNRLMQLLGLLSQALALPGQVRLLQQKSGNDSVLALLPATTGSKELSGFYDAASAAARFVDGRLYVGTGNTFVQYRDDSAPHGYDVPGFKPAEGEKEWLLIAHWGSQILKMADFQEFPLVDFCLQVAPIPAPAGKPPAQVYALVPSALYPSMARYCRNHRLHYSVAQLVGADGDLILLDISPQPGALTGRQVPKFALDYLSRLPRVVVLTPAYQTENRCILLQWQHHFPLRLPHIAGAFADGDLILLIADHYPNLRIHPTPQFFDGDQLTQANMHRQSAWTLIPKPADNTPALQLPILLRPDNGPTPPTAALIFDKEEMGWLRQFLYRLPGDAFGAYNLCEGREGAVLVGGNRPIEGIPFGLPLRRIGDTEVFIPLRSNFVPDLPWAILRETLEIKPGMYTFFADHYRLDVPVSGFAPLSRALVADPERPRTNFVIASRATLPELRWTPPSPPPGDAQSGTAPRRADSALSRLLRPRNPTGAPPEPQGAIGNTPKPEFDPTAHWRQQAQTYEEAHDYLAAAICYSLLNDISNSSRCFRLAVSAASSATQTGSSP